MTFRRNIAYMIDLFVFPLGIPVIINILHEMVKIIHVKMLNALYYISIDSITMYQRKITEWSFQ